MFDEAKTLKAFYILLSSLSTSQQEKILEVYLRNGKKLSLKVEVRDNTPDDRRLKLVTPPHSSFFLPGH